MTTKNSEDINQKAMKQLKEMQDQVQKFKDKALERFQSNIMGIALEPKPSKKQAKQEQRDADAISVLVLIDDMDSKKLSKEELRSKTQNALNTFAKPINSKLQPKAILVSDVWQDCYDSKYEFINRFAQAATIHDDGMLAAFKISSLHKRMVLEKFEKYIVSYVLAGSLVQGKATPESDIDVFIIIDDTDVKKMGRAELKDKLRAIIVNMGQQAGKQLGISKHFNIQVYILTDFWEFMKDANPIIFTFLRDGVPLYDRGVFMPWKQLLKMGRIKPSPEAIDMMIHSGSQVLGRVDKKLKEIGMEDFFWATVTTSQAAIMLYGYPPPTPKETTDLLEEIFVKKEGLLEKKYVKTVKKALKLRKDLEHGSKKKVSGKEIDKLLEESKAYLERCKKLFDEIQSLKDGENFAGVIEETKSHLYRALEVDEVSDKELLKAFKKGLVGKAGFTSHDHKELKKVLEVQNKQEKDGVSKAQRNKHIKVARRLLRKIVEHVQRREFQRMQKTKLVAKFEDGFAELHFFKTKIYLFYKEEADEDGTVKSIKYTDKKINKPKKSSRKELEKALETKEKVTAFANKELTERVEEEIGTKVTFMMS